jgi:hypothetical protein
MREIQVIFQHSFRECNLIADGLANLACQHRTNQSFFFFSFFFYCNDLPRKIKAKLFLDKSGIFNIRKWEFMYFGVGNSNCNVQIDRGSYSLVSLFTTGESL